MPRYRVMVLREMSQSLDVCTDTPDEAAQWALAHNDLSANVGNNFEDSDEERVFSIVNADTGEEIWQSGGPQDDSWEGMG